MCCCLPLHTVFFPLLNVLVAYLCKLFSSLCYVFVASLCELFVVLIALLCKLFISVSLNCWLLPFATCAFPSLLCVGCLPRQTVDFPLFYVLVASFFKLLISLAYVLAVSFCILYTGGRGGSEQRTTISINQNEKMLWNEKLWGRR